MAIVQDKALKDRLLIVETDQLGAKDRGNLVNNASIYGNPSDFHPAVRTSFGTKDNLRGVLGSYMTRYNSTAGETLENYSGIVNRLRNGDQPGSTDQGPGNIGPLRDQFIPRQGGVNVNLVFDPTFNDNDSITLQRNFVAWNSYENVTAQNGNNAAWFEQNFVEYVEGPSLTVSNFNGNTLVYNGLLSPFNFTNQSFTDHTSVHYLISSDKDARSKSGLTTNVEPTYNYYVTSAPNYEDVIADSRINEYLIPNVYYLQLELRNTSSTFLQEYHKSSITLDNTVPWFNGQNVENDRNRYYSLYARKMSEAIETIGDDTRNKLARNNRDIAVLHSDLPVLTGGYLKESSIPFYNKITIGYDTEKDISGPNGSAFLAQIYNDPDTRDFIDILQGVAVYSYYNRNSAPFLNFSTREKKITDSEGSFDFDSQDTQYRLLFDFILMMQNRLTSNIGWTEFIQNKGAGLWSIPPVKFLRDYFGKQDVDPDGYGLLESEENVLLDFFNNGAPAAVLEAYKRTMEQVFLNQTCHTETLMYVVEKYRIAAGGDELVQTILISPKMTPGGALDTTYYDSQIKYNQKYRYEFKKIALIFGNEYSYDTVVTSPSTGQVNVQYTNELSIKAALLPYSYEGIEVAVIDRPPVAPILSFYPIKGVDNKVKIRINPSTGDYMDKPVAILDSDRQFIEEEYYGQFGVELPYDEIRQTEKKIRYRSDDLVDKYQLFRIVQRPTSYESFNGVNNYVNINPAIGVAGSYQDTIIPNVKYYYCARAVDIHENMSNPTHIFEIEMFNNEGQVYLRQKTLTFEQDKPEVSKDGRRFIYVEPSFQQVALNTEMDMLTPDNVDVRPTDGLLGTAEQSCWQETFKVRVTSKKTGRKIDLNLTFKNTGVDNPTTKRIKREDGFTNPS